MISQTPLSAQNVFRIYFFNHPENFNSNSDSYPLILISILFLYYTGDDKIIVTQVCALQQLYGGQDQSWEKLMFLYVFFFVTKGESKIFLCWSTDKLGRIWKELESYLQVNLILSLNITSNWVEFEVGCDNISNWNWIKIDLWMFPSNIESSSFKCKYWKCNL